MKMVQRQKRWFMKWTAAMVAVVMMLGVCSGLPAKAVTSADLTISQNGVDFICAREGFSSKCYYDGNQSSIGYGTKCGTTAHASGLHSITRGEAMTAMMNEINSAYVPNVRKQTSGIEMNQNQFDALVSFTYNTGGGTTMIKNSPLVKYLRGELTESEARSQFSNYIVTNSATGKVDQGLINRRNAEADLFFSGSNPNPPTWYDNLSPVDIGTDFYATIRNQYTDMFFTNNNGNVEGQNYNNSDSQQWKFERQSDGSYKIISKSDSLPMDVYDGARQGEGSTIRTYEDNGSTAQRYYIYYMYYSYYIRPQCTDYLVDMDVNNNPGNVAVWAMGENFNPQKFDIIKTELNGNTPVDLGTEFYATIRNQYTDMFFTNNNGNVEGQNYNNSDSQQWKFERQSDGSYKIISKSDSLPMDVYDGARQGEGSTIRTYEDNGSTAQRYYIYYMYYSYYIRPQCTDYLVDMDVNNNPGNVAVWAMGENFNPQKFDILKMDTGNINCDDVINVTDAVLLQKYLLNQTTLTETQYNLADLNADGKVNGFDLALLRQKLLA